MYNGPYSSGTPGQFSRFQNTQEQPQLSSLGEAIVSIAVVAGGLYLLDRLLSDAPRKLCGGCGKAGHDRRTCPYTNARAGFSRSVPKSRNCECCGSNRFA